MKRKWLVILSVVLAVILAVSGGMLISQHLDDKNAANAELRAAQAAGVTLPSAAPSATPEPAPAETPEAPPAVSETPQEDDDPYAAALAETDLAALRAENSDVIGWLYIQDTDISHPLLQGTDNDYYLSHAWNGEQSRSGAIFLDSQVDPGLEDFNTIVYGHNMRSDVMFSNLKLFADQDHWAQHPAVYIVTDGCVRRYAIYAAWEAGLRDTPYYLKVTRPEHKQALIDESLDRSVIQTGIVPTVDDYILTLSTCNDRGRTTRWVVQAVLDWKSG